MTQQSDFGTIAQNRMEVREGTILMFPGVNDFRTLLVEGTGTLASPTMTLYLKSTDVSATYLSGSMSVVGRTIKTKTFTGLVGGSDYTAYIYFTDDGAATARIINIAVPKLGVNPARYQHADFKKYRVTESPIMILPGQSITPVLSIAGYGTISGTPTMSVYKKTNDDSANVLSGSVSVTGREITLKTISGLAGGSEYIAYVFFTDNGKSTARYFDIICPKLGS